jgi:translocation and assembly module TamB
MPTVKRMTRWSAEVVVIVLGTVALLLAVLYGLAHTQPGRAWIARNLAAALSLPGESVLAIGRLDGFLPDAIRLIDVRASDPTGTWLSARKVTLDWRPLDLFRGIFRVTALRIENLEVQRIPRWQIETEVSSDYAGFPYLPLDAVVERLLVDDVALGPEVLGIAARFRVSGVAAAAGSNRLLFSFAVERTDGVAGYADFMALYHLADRRLTLDSNINEPAGGLAARLLDIPELPPIVMNLNGDGPLNGWRGRLSGSLVNQATIAAAIELRGESPIVFRVIGEVENIGSYEDLPWRLLAGRTPFQVAGEWRQTPSRRLVLDRASFTGSAADLELSGEFEPDLLQLDARSSLVLKDDTIMARLIDGAEAEGIALGIEARGHLLQPEIRLEAAAQRLHLPGLSTEAALAQLTFRPDHVFGGEPLRGALFGSGRFGSFLYDNVPQLEPVFGRSYAWQFNGQLDLAQANFWADQVAIRTERAEVTGSSAFDFAEGTMNAELEMEVYDLGGLGQLLGIDIQGNGHLAGPLELRDFGRTLHAPLSGQVREVTLGENISHALLQGDSDIAAALSVDADGNFWITDVLVASGPAQLSGKVGFTERFGKIFADYRVAVSDIGVLSEALGTELAGSGLFEGQAQGAPINPRLSGTLSVTEAAVADLDFGQLQVDYSIGNLAGKPSGHLDAQATAPVDAMAGQTDYVFEGPLLHLNNTRLTAENTWLHGDVTFLLGRGATRAEVSGQIGDLKPWLALAGLAGGGATEAELHLESREGRQAVRLNAAFAALSLRLQDGALLRVGEARVELDTSDLDNAQDGRATLEAKALRLGEFTLSRGQAARGAARCA